MSGSFLQSQSSSQVFCHLTVRMLLMSSLISSTLAWFCSCFIFLLSDFVTVDNLTSKQIKIVNEKYLDGNPDLSLEKVMRSSKAAGPLYQVSSFSAFVFCFL